LTSCNCNERWSWCSFPCDCISTHQSDCCIPTKNSIGKVECSNNSNSSNWIPNLHHKMIRSLWIKNLATKLNKTYPIVLDNPQAISQISIVYCTYPNPSDNIFPIYSETNLPKGYFLALNASPICLTISPLIGIGIEAHYFWAGCILLIAFS